MIIEKIYNLILDFLYPKHCIFCYKKGNYICDECYKTFDINSTFFCPKCLKPLIYTTHNCNIKYIDINGIAMIVLKNNKNISKLISNFKYKFNKEIKYYIEKLIEKYIEINNILLPNDTIITYVPITKKRWIWRGFNQAKEIANILSKITNIPTYELIYKKKNTKNQKELNKSQRYTNLNNVFEAKNIESLKNINHIILVDDIITTGTTLKQCINAIKEKINKKDITFHIFVLSHGTK